MPTIVRILTFISKINFMLSQELSLKKFDNLEAYELYGFCNKGTCLLDLDQVRPCLVCTFVVFMQQNKGFM